MKRERTIVGGLLVLQLLLWLGFLVHRSPRFPGSVTGGVFAVAAAALLVLPPLLYSATKRIGAVRQLVTPRVSLGTLLAWHVYTGIVGSMLAIVHTGHRFESNIGIWLTAMMLLTVLSGFIGRYYLGYASLELHEKQDLLTTLATEYNRMVGEMARQPDPEIAYAASHHPAAHALDSLVGTDAFQVDAQTPPSRRALRLAESIADLEYAIKTHEVLKRRMAGWLLAHIVTSSAFYLLLVAHVWSEIYFGLRWFR